MTAASRVEDHRRRPWLVLLALAVALGLAGAALRAARFRTDLADLLPHAATPAARFMLRELRAGAANRLILIGLDSAPAPRLATLIERNHARGTASNVVLHDGGQHSLDVDRSASVSAADALLTRFAATRRFVTLDAWQPVIARP